MSRVRVEVNPNLERELLATNEAVELALEAAEEVADVARDGVAERTRNLKKSINAVAGRVDGQALGRVNADDFKAAWVEFGTAQPGGRAQPYLRPAAEEVLGAVTQAGGAT